ncbi:MAG: ABC transporter ATP-binding protein [Chloroflexi bacterium]|nr:ABC transporter ATP-binding protein [Chloroflexota bacterium]
MEKVVYGHSELDPTGQVKPAFRPIIPKVIKVVAVHWRILMIASSMSAVLSFLLMAPPILIGVIIDRAILGENRHLLILLSWGLIGSAVAICLVSLVQGYFLTLLAERIVNSVRVMLFEALQRQSYRFYLNTNSGAVVSRMWNDVTGIQSAVTSGLSEVFGALILLAVALTVMFIWNWTLALIAVSLLPVIFLVSLFMGHVNESTNNRLFRKLEEMTSFTYERLNISGFILLSGFGYDRSRDSVRFTQDTNELISLSVRQDMAVRVVSLTLGLITTLVSALIYIYGGFQVIGGELSLGTLAAFIVITMMIATPVSDLANLHVNFVGSLAPFRRVFDWIDLTPEINDAECALDLPVIQGRLTFNNVSFEYEPAMPVIERLSFEIQPGQLVALVGPSGAGKTTIAYLILRFYDPTSGHIEIDGNDLRYISLSSLRRHTSVVPQEGIVFNTTIRENLLIAKPDATLNEMNDACDIVQLGDLIRSLPDKYDTVVGEFGYRLSGGERQRLAIARAILKRPSLLIMDEPTSSLDSITARAVRDALGNVLSQSTTVVIAHRLSTILSADRILVIDKGQCVDFGRHDELLARSNLYRHLYKDQFAAQNEVPLKEVRDPLSA